MSDPSFMPRRSHPHGVVRADLAPPPNGPASLADILERVLDKGIVIAGDIQVNLLDIELLTIKIRLLVASVDRAKEMGIDWWEGDPTLSGSARELARENAALEDRLERLEGQLALMAGERDADRVEVTERSRAVADPETGKTVSEQSSKRVTEDKS